jgi:glycosyltransferase involved in cell wall biosynthesis
MILGIEARWLSRGPISGRTVFRGLIPHIVEATARTGDQVILFVDHRDAARVSRSYGTAAHVSVVSLLYPTRRFGVTWLLGPAVNRHGVDVLVSATFVPHWCRAATVSYIFDILFESHPEYFSAAERFYFRGVRRSCRRATRILALSHATRDDLVRHGYAEPQRIDVVYPGCATPAPIHGATGSPPVPTPYFLYVGRLNERKNIPRLLRASARLLRETDTHLVLVGQPDGKLAKHRLVPPPEIGDRVHFLGYVDDDALASLYRSALALVYIPFAEGFGLPVIEAMRYGLPVVASDGPGLAEAVGHAGLVVDPMSEEAVAHAMHRLATDRKLRAALREHALQWARRFTWESAATNVLAACAAAASSDSRAGGVR